jgi:hypothetical protein
VRRGAASCRAVLAAVQWRRRSGRGAGAFTAEPSWVERPGRRDRARSDCPAGGRRSRGCPDAGQAGRCPVRLVRSRRGECPSTGRADVQRPRVRCPGVRCIQVSGRTGLRCPRCCRRAVRAAPDWSAGRPRLGAAGRRALVVGGRRGRLPPSTRTGREGAALAVAGWHEVDRSPGPPLGRRPGCGAAWPPADRGCWSRPGCQPGGAGAWDRAGAPRPPQGVLGWSPV